MSVKYSSKFYSRSLTLLIPILELIHGGYTISKISKKINLDKSHVSYYVAKAKKLGYVREIFRDTFTHLELTEAGQNFLAMYQSRYQSSANGLSTPRLRAENIRFKALVYKMPASPPGSSIAFLSGWNKRQMNHWDQYSIEISGIKVNLNTGKDPTIEFIMPPTDANSSDDTPNTIYVRLVQQCNLLAKELGVRLRIGIGMLELSSNGEWVVYDPVARQITKEIGSVNIKGYAKINASKPGRIGEIEFHDPRDAADYSLMPRHLSRVEWMVKELWKAHTSKQNN
jgi:DNA-binding MarR family transcriptional regulator